LQALVPAVVVRPVVRDDVAGQGPDRMEIRLGGLPGRLGPVDVAEQLDAGGRVGEPAAVAARGRGAQGGGPAGPPWLGAVADASVTTGAQPGAPPCRAV